MLLKPCAKAAEAGTSAMLAGWDGCGAQGGQ